ncbi:PREDICTED: structural maintenance of chromosomes protein 2-like, partial [Acanthisitta chloris]|uniref:structural maintenance of chromosomes protein 2-like n=1 Tax=Acanthisitta chloris TaxID=57068 RepID=UPI0004F0D7B1
KQGRIPTFKLIDFCAVDLCLLLVFNSEEEKEEALLAKKKALTCDIIRLRELHEGLMAKCPHLRFEYRHPEKNWNESKVKGLIMSLFTVEDLSKAIALEAVAGAKLFNIVVDTVDTGKKLLKGGCLKTRYTIIPLNQISFRKVQPNVIKLAESLAGSDKLCLAISLIVYEPELHVAMEYVFGTTLICNDMDIAKEVTFDRRIMMRSVTLDGDVFDPQGVVHGGASSQSAAILPKLQAIKKVEVEIQEKETELKAVEKELAILKNVSEKYRQLKQQWEMQAENAELLQKKLHQSAYHKQEEELLALKKTIAEYEETLNKAKESKKKAEDKYKALEDKMKNAEAECVNERKIAEQKIHHAKKKAVASSKKVKDMQQKFAALVLELEELKQEQASCKQQIVAVEEAIKSYQEQVDAMAAEMPFFEEAVKNSQKVLTELKKEIALYDNGIKAKSTEVAQCREQNNKSQLKIKELEHKVTQCKEETAEAAEKVVKMLKTYKWIASEKKYFGQPNTNYDFNSLKPEAVSQELQKLKEHKEKLRRNVNIRAPARLTETEDRFKDLLEKRNIVEKDKMMILQTIKELDQKKNEALDVAWKKVNADFGSIFSTLLPGAKAKLTASKTQNVFKGMEFKVALGNTWKENLMELSGGQRL